MRELELYVHIPFCIRKCGYCDFLSFPTSPSRQAAYVEALRREIKGGGKVCEGRVVTSVFLGGGTPSVLESAQIASILGEIRDNYYLAADCEITIEANPGTLTEEKLKGYLKAGINRLSMGCQSTREEELKSLGRIHTYQEFLEQYRLAREAGFANINVDLMSAIPGQRLKHWEENLRTIAGLHPEHISAYSLIVEEGTPFYERELDLPCEEEERLMYQRTEEILKEYGYHRYEISNYARENYECRHNVGYWKRREYLGFGIGAASLWEGERFLNLSDFEEYLRLSGDAEKIRRNREVLTTEDAMEEYMFLGLRMMEGVSKREFAREFGRSMEEVYEKALKKMIAQGLLEEKGDRIRLTKEGISLSNQVFVEFMF